MPIILALIIIVSLQKKNNMNHKPNSLQRYSTRCCSEDAVMGIPAQLVKSGTLSLWQSD